MKLTHEMVVPASVDEAWADRLGGLDRFLDRVDDLVAVIAVHQPLLGRRWDAITGRITASRLCVWTVNDADTMAALVETGVDGLITDYPDEARRVLTDLGVALPAPA